MSTPSLKALTGVYFRAGNFTFGGGEPTTAVVQRELVFVRRWLTAEQFALVFSLARITPGTNVLAFFAGTAWLLRGWKGAVLAVLSICLPSAAFVVWLTHSLVQWGDHPWVKAVSTTVMACASGMIAASAWLLIAPFVKLVGPLRTLVVAGGAAALALSGLSPIPVLAAAAIAGALWRDQAPR
jgi:chromate transporter